VDIGHYVPTPAMMVGGGRKTHDGSPLDQPFPVWEFAFREEIRFFPDLESLPVKSALSIEAGGKTRLVTAGLASVAQIGQLIRHPIAEWLGLDQTLRVGFDEPDKLWEVLKAFQKGGGKPSEDWWIISTDLKEATYNMSFQLLDVNLELIDEQFARLPVWRVFSRLFKVHRRTVLLEELKEKGYLPPDHPDTLVSQTGAFMGDSLSFMHLTITLNACSLVAGFAAQSRWDIPKWAHLGDGFVHRPYMQIVGDDHLAVGATARYCQVFRQTVEGLQLVLSKIDAVNRWFGTFAENSFCIPSDLGELQDYASGSRFGSLVFLDVIKGSILAGQAKVKGDGQSPFIGHAKMLSTQIEWHPIAFVRERAPVLIGLRNFRETKGLASANPYFPLELGGLGIPLGTLHDFDNVETRRLFGAYLERMLQADEEEFRVCWLLLQSVAKPSPKGVPWEASPEMLTSIVSQLETVAEGPVMANLPSYIADKGRSTMAKYLQAEYGLLSMRNLTDHLARRKAFEDFWFGRASDPNYLQLGAAEYRRRFRSVWSELRRRLRPVEVVTLSSLKEAAKKVQQRTFGLLFSEEDPAILEYFHGMGSLTVIYGQQRL